MSSFIKGIEQAFTAGEDLSAKQYHFVKFGSSDTEVVACGDGESAIGVLMNAPASGEDAVVVIEGGALLKTSGIVARGALVACDADGQGDAGTSGDPSIAKAFATSAAGDVIHVRIGLDAAIA